MKKFFLVVWMLCGVGSSFAALDASQMANYDAAVASYKARAEAIRVNRIATRAQSALPSGTSAVNTFGNLALKNAGNNDLSLVTKGSLSLGGKPLVIDVESKISKPSLVGALGRFAGKVIPVLNTGVAIYDLTKELDRWAVEQDSVTKVPKFSQVVDGLSCQSNCFEYQGRNNFDLPYVGDWMVDFHAAALQACMDVHRQRVSFDCSTMVISADNSSWTVWGNAYYGTQDQSTGGQIGKREVLPYNTSKIESRSPEQWAEAISNDSSAIASLQIGDLIRDALASGEQILVDSPVLTGPAVLPGTTSTTSNSDGSTSTVTTSHQLTYQGDNIIDNVTTVTNNCVSSGACSSSTTTTENKSPDPVTDTKTDCEKNPSLIGCAEFGTPEDPKLSKINKPFTLAVKTFSGSGSCPSPLSFAVRGLSYEVGFQPICDQLVYLKALMLMLAGVMAAYILADSFKVG